MGLDDLPGLFEDLDDVIDRRASSGRLAFAPRKVFLTGPPNVLAGGFTGCLTGDHDYEKNLRSDERSWLTSFVVPTLVDAMDAAAADNGWTFVDTIPAVPNGICSGAGRMINRNRDALPVQGATVANAPRLRVSDGWVHPNASGFAAMGGLLAENMRPHVISTFTPGQAGTSAPAPVETLSNRVVMRVGDAPQAYTTRPAAIRPTDAPSAGATVAGANGDATVDVPVSPNSPTASVTVMRCGPLAPSVAPPEGCGPGRTVANVLTGTPGVPTGVSATRDPLGVRVRWQKGSPASTPVRRFLVQAELRLADTGLNPTDALSNCTPEENIANGPSVGGRQCGSPLPRNQPRAPIVLDFEFPDTARDVVLPVATGGNWRVTVRECTDRGCAGKSTSAGTTSGLSPLGAQLVEALNRPSVLELRQARPVGVFTTLAGRTARAGSTFPLRIAWGAWGRWSELKELRVRLLGAQGEVATMRVDLKSKRLTVQAPGSRARKGKIGKRATLSAGRLSLLSRGARLAGSGPKGRLVALELPVRLARALRGQRLDVEIAASTAGGQRQDYGWAGALDVSR